MFFAGFCVGFVLALVIVLFIFLSEDNSELLEEVRKNSKEQNA